MFDISWTELMVIALVAIVVVGPKDLPRALRAVGKVAGKAKRMAREFQSHFNEALREAELDTIKNEVDSLRRFDPMADMKREMREIEAGIKSPPKSSARPKPAIDRELNEIAADDGSVEPAPQPAAEAPATQTAEAKP